MIIDGITMGELAQCYFPNLIQSVATAKLQERIKHSIEPYYKTLIERGLNDADGDPCFKLETGDVINIGMSIGYPREKLVQDVRDTITWGYNWTYDLKDPIRRARTFDAFRRLDERLNPPLEFYDCEEIKESKDKTN